MKGTQTVSNGSDGARDVRWGILFKGVVAAASAAAAAGMLRLFAMSAGMERIDERTLKMAADFEAVRHERQSVDAECSGASAILNPRPSTA